MVIKKSLVFLLGIIFLSSLVLAQSIEIEFPNNNQFESNEQISFKITLRDSQNNIIEDDIFITLEDIEKTKKIEKTIRSRELVNIDLGENILAGEWKVTAKYNDEQITESFLIKAKEQISFELNEDMLVITNTGNKPYTPKIQITIGETVGDIKEPNLKVNGKISYRLIAPKGNYAIKVIDINNPEDVFLKTNVALTGKGLTGKAIGILDEQASQGSLITGGISPDESDDEALFTYLRNSKFVYVFVLVIFGAMILIAIERQYRRKSN